MDVLRLSSRRRTRLYHVLGLPVGLALLLGTPATGMAQADPSPVVSQTTSATPDTATPAASPASGGADSVAPQIAIASSISPATVAGTDQVIVTQSVVVTGDGVGWTVTTPLTSNLTYRNASVVPAGTSGTTADISFDALTNTVIVTGKVEAGQPRGQARIRIVTAVPGGNPARDIFITSSAALDSGDASDDSAAFLNIAYPDETASRMVSQTPSNAEASASTTSDATPATLATPVEAATPGTSAEATVASPEPASPEAPVAAAETTVEPAATTAPEEASSATTSEAGTAEGAEATTGEAAKAEEEPVEKSNRNLFIIVGATIVLVGGFGAGIARNLKEGGPTGKKH